MKKIITLFIVLPLYSLCLKAQPGFSFPAGSGGGGTGVALATGWQAIDVNPSNLGWSDSRPFSAAFLNFGVNASANQLTVGNISKAVGGDTSVLRSILTTGNGLSIGAAINEAALSFNIPVIGGLAVSISDRAYANIFAAPTIGSKSGLNTMVAAVANMALTTANAAKANGNVNINVADSLDVLASSLNTFTGTSVSAYDYREVSFDYGREVYRFGGGDKNDPDFDFNSFKLYGGLGINYLIGMADVSGTVLNNSISANYAFISSKNAYSLIPTDAPGHGVGVDLGASMIYRQFKFGLAVTDLGSISWNGTNSTLSDTALIGNIVRNRGDTGKGASDISNAVQNTSTKFKTVLPAKLRFGASYQVIEEIAFATDIIIPLNNAPGNLFGPYVAVSAHLTPVKALTFDIGISVTKDYGASIPVGLSIGNKVQFYAGVTDLLTYFGKSTDADYSVIIGLLRINL